MRIGPPKRVIEVDPVETPVPGVLPEPFEPAPAPSEPVPTVAPEPSDPVPDAPAPDTPVKEPAERRS